MNICGRKTGCKSCELFYRDGRISGEEKAYDDIISLVKRAKDKSFKFDLAIPHAKEDSKTDVQHLKSKIAALVRGWDAALPDKKLKQAEYMAEEMRTLEFV